MDLQLAKGVRDVPPEEKIVQNKIVNILQEVFELYGFVPLETPILERFETLAAKGGAGEGSDALKETFQLTDQGERKLGLRFELTTSLARFIGMNPQLRMPFKRYEMGPVFRDGPIKLGRYRQFWQCDIDTIGCKSMLAEAEILGVVQTVFDKLGLEVVVKVNNRKLLNGILEQAGIKEKEEALISIDKLDKVGKRGVALELIQRGYTEEQIQVLFDLISAEVTLADLKEQLTDPEALEGMKELTELFFNLDNLGVTITKFDVSLARGLSYYTGTVFEVYLKNGKFSSALAGGGRYDSMVGKFLGGGREIPGVGVAFGLAPIMDILKMEKEWKEKTPAQAYVIPIKTVADSLKVVQELRAAGIKVDFDLNSRNVSKNLEYISALGIPYALIIGEDEIKQNKVLVRDMDSGQQQLLTLKETIKKLQEQ